MLTAGEAVVTGRLPELWWGAGALNYIQHTVSGIVNTKIITKCIFLIAIELGGGSSN